MAESLKPERRNGPRQPGVQQAAVGARDDAVGRAVDDERRALHGALVPAQGSVSRIGQEEAVLTQERHEDQDQVSRDGNPGARAFNWFAGRV